jgi:GTP-binding protein
VTSTNPTDAYIVNHAEILISAVRRDQYPADGLPEIAFAGKSNVGKSSLINAMLGRKSLARSSQHPGKTRTINFYQVDERLLFVDLPGYGYAKVSKSESAKWGAMVEGYLLKREPLKLIVLLLDIRHEPGNHDKQLYEWCAYHQLPLLTVATKSDKLKKSQLQKHLAVLRKGLDATDPPLAFSSESKDGRDALWAVILDKCGLAVV